MLYSVYVCHEIVHYRENNCSELRVPGAQENIEVLFFLHLYQDYIVDKNYLIVDRLLCSGFDQATKLLLRLWLKGYPDN